MANRIAFTQGGVIVQVSMCDLGRCDEWCRINGYDGWAEATAEPADVLREVEEGDAITAPLKPGTRELDKTKASVTRFGVTFVTAGVRDYAKLAQANALRPQPPEVVDTQL